MTGPLIVFFVVLTALLALYGACALLARIFGGNSRQRREFRECVFCGIMTPVAEDRCQWCGRGLGSPLAAELADLRAVERQLARFRDTGALEAQTVASMLERVGRYRAGLLGPAAAAPAAVAGQDEPVIVAEVVAEPAPAPPAPPAAVSVPAAGTASATPPAISIPAPPPPAEAAPTKPRPPVAPPPPRKSWTELLAGFMEERNIRWGELIGGLLIVGPTVALVISFWETLERNPYLKASVLVATCAAVFAVGLYAHHRWKLHSTSRGLLMIAVLLVPLDFLALAAVWKEDWSLGTVSVDLVALGIFAALVSLAGRVLVPGGQWLQALAVLGSSAGLLILARLVGPDAAHWKLVAAGCLPVACFAVGIGWFLWRLSSQEPLEPAQAMALFTLLGTAAFALVISLGLLAWKVTRVEGRLELLAVPLALAGPTILAAGLTVVRGTARDAAQAAQHAAGTWTALVAAIVMLVALGLAWPQPAWLIGVGTLNCVVLALAAFYYRLPILHAPSIACLALVYLVVFHVAYPPSELPLLSGGKDLGPQMLRLALHGSSGTALGGLFALVAVAAELLVRAGRRRDGAVYAGGSAVVAVFGLLLVTTHGLQAAGTDALRATILYAVYGSGSLALAGRWRRIVLGYIGLGLLTGASLWALWFATEQLGQIWATVLAAEVLAMGLIAASLRRHGGLSGMYRTALLSVAEIVSPAAAVLAIWSELPWAAPSHLPPAAYCLPATAGLLAAFYLLTAWGYRSPQRTWVGSLLVLAGLVHGLRFACAGYVEHPWLIALLAHSSAAMLAGVLVDICTSNHPRRNTDLSPPSTAHRLPSTVYGLPLTNTALFSSALSLLVLPLEVWQGGMSTWSLAWCLFWLAAIWLVISWRNGHRGLFAAHQAMLAAAVVAATTAWLKGQSWVTHLPHDLLQDPRSLHAYGITLAALSSLWVGLRILLRGNKAAQRLLSPTGPSVDRVLRHGVVWSELLLIGWHLWPGIAQESWPSLTVSAKAQLATQLACGPGAWALLALTAVVLAATLWYRWRISLFSSVLLAATVPLLIAGRFTGAGAVASAVRWGSAVCFVACTAIVCGRQQLFQILSRLRANVDVGPLGPSVARATLLATTAAPVLILTLLAAPSQFARSGAGPSPPFPAAGSFFAQLGPVVSYTVPLLLVTLGLVAHALRERSGGYAFSAGLVAELVVTLGYALRVVTDPNPARSFGSTEFVVLLQLATITAAAWAGAWLAVRHWQHARATPPGATGSASTTRLLDVQLGIPAVGNALLLSVGLTLLAFFHLSGVQWQQWTIAAGRPLGWIALAAAVAAYVYRQAQSGRQLQPQVVGLTGMAALGLLACGVLWLWPLRPEWAYRTLMLGWAAHALFIALGTWWLASIRSLPDAQGPPQALIRTAAVWVRAAGIPAVLLGLKAALFHQADEDRLWAAAAIAIASGAGAAMAVWRRREGWAFSAALGVNLAASLVVWYLRRDDSFADWWLRLAQANVIASAAVALVWLAVRSRLYQLREFTLGESPLLALQTAVPLLGNYVLLAVPVACLVHAPDHLPGSIARLAGVPGWLGLLLCSLSAGWYCSTALAGRLPGNLLDVLGGLGLGAGVLVTCHTAGVSNRPAWNEWLEYHTLTTAWAVVGLIVLGTGMALRNLRLAFHDDGRPRLSGTAGELVFPRSAVQSWVTGIGALVLVLAVIHAAGDPARPWWSGGAILSASAMAAVVALWLRQPAYVYASGLLLNVAGVITWMAWDKGRTASGLLSTNVFCLAIGSACWSLLGAVCPKRVPHAELQQRPVPFSQLAALGGMALLAAPVAVAVACETIGAWQVAVGRLDWIALGSTAAALVICLLQRPFRLGLPGLYVLALTAIGMGLCRWTAGQRELCSAAAVALAAFVLATAVLAMCHRWLAAWHWRDPSGTSRLHGAWQDSEEDTLGEGRYWPADWFAWGQAGVAGVAAALGPWISLDRHFDCLVPPALGGLSGRVFGPLSAALLLAAAILLAAYCRDRWRNAWQQAALVLGLMITSELGFVYLVPQSGAWLHRSVILMVAALVMALVPPLVLGRFASAAGDWPANSRRIAPVFGGLAMLTAGAVLVQEGLFFHRLGNVPMAWPTIAVVALALAALAGVCVALAVRADWDPLRLAGANRHLYVYAAEFLGALIGLHVWLTAPELFRLGFEQYWMLVVMGVAFGGAGLDEFFRRRELPVLSRPLERTALLLPLVPAVGFWFTAQPDLLFGLAGSTPLFWLLVGLFYGVMAVTRRSLLATAGAVAGTQIGLWVLLYRQELRFDQHPQLWLIPLALAALVAEHLDRHRLSDAQRTALRYLALSMIYISSTTEFLRGIGESVWLPLALTGLSVLGVLAGILLRVRSFLYLGLTFLMVVIVRMIVYAAFERGRIEVFWVSCIILGISIIALFALVEKRRNEVLAAVERFRQWDH